MLQITHMCYFSLKSRHLTATTTAYGAQHRSGDCHGKRPPDQSAGSGRTNKHRHDKTIKTDQLPKLALDSLSWPELARPR